MSENRCSRSFRKKFNSVTNFRRGKHFWLCLLETQVSPGYTWSVNFVSKSYIMSRVHYAIEQKHNLDIRATELCRNTLNTTPIFSSFQIIALANEYPILSDCLFQLFDPFIKRIFIKSARWADSF